MTAKSFGGWIRSAREKLKLTQRDAAVMIEISPQYLSDIECGRRNPPSNSVLFEISLVLDVSFIFLLMLAGRFPDYIDVSVYTPKVTMRAWSKFKDELERSRSEWEPT